MKVTQLPKLAMTAAALLVVAACDSAQKASNGTAAENVVLPADETARPDDAGVAAAMHNQMSGAADSQAGSAGAGMADDQRGSGSMPNSSMSGGMGNGQMGGMMDDNMPMSGNMADHHKGMNNMGGAKPKSMPKKDASPPMQDDM